MSEPVVHHRVLTPEGGSSSRFVFFLHGILGAGRNWAPVALRMTRLRPDWGAVLVDLRLHGESVGFPPPHTLDACVSDLGRLVSALGPRESVLLGHSFGGKVALLSAGEPVSGVRQAWIVDSTPAPVPAGLVGEVLAILRGLPGSFAERRQAVVRLIEAGLERSKAEWLAAGLERSDEGYRWRHRFDDIEQLLGEYCKADLWPLVENRHRYVELVFVRARDGSAITDEAAARLAALEERDRRVCLFELAGGHWLNTDNPQGLLRLLRQRLPLP